MKALILSVLIAILPAWANSQSSINPIAIVGSEPIVCSQCGFILGYGDRRLSIGHQHAFLPAVYVDSLIFETKQSRQCSKVISGLTQENSWLDSLRQTQDQEIALYQDVIANQNEILAGFPRELKANAQTCEAEKKALKRQIRRARRAAIVTGAGLAFCLVLLL